MQVKRYKPITPSLRHKILANTIRSQFKNDKNPFSSKKEGWFKYLKYNKLSAQAKGGRNNQGKITVRCRGGGHKRRLRLIDRSRELGIYTKSEIIDIQYNPNISSNIALLSTLNTPSIKFYILASNTMKIGDIISFVNDANKVIAYPCHCPEGSDCGGHNCNEITITNQPRHATPPPLTILQRTSSPSTKSSEKWTWTARGR